MEKLSQQEIERYHRHLILPQVDESGQQKLKNASVLIIGMGGLGSPIALYLAAAGIGTIGIMDDDVVSSSNLQRQVIHSETTVGKLKIESAAERLHQLNSFTHIKTYAQRFTADAASILSEYDIVMDATDNFTARYAINAACVQYEKPMVYGAVFNFDGQYSIFAPHLGTPCYQCVFPNPPQDTGEEIGVFGILPGVIGSMQATEALKLTLEIGTPALNRLITYNALETEWYTIQVERKPNCPICSQQSS